jgi:hypothetical protein
MLKAERRGRTVLPLPHEWYLEVVYLAVIRKTAVVAPRL